MRYVRSITVVAFIVTLVAWALSAFSVHRNRDTVPPVIKAEESSIKVSVHGGDAELLKGLKAEDNKDGDLTENILIGSQSKFVHKGLTQVEYLVFDSSNNVGRCTRNVEYTDYESPEFYLIEPLMYKTGEKISVFDRLRVMDAIDGDISDKMKIISSDVDTSKPGTYSLGVEASNKFGDLVSLQIPVNVIENNNDAPEIRLNTYSTVIRMGESFDPMAFVDQVILSDGTSPGIDVVTIDSGVNVSEPGASQVEYSYTDASGNRGVTYLMVEVRE